jgi:hypothetical protein
MLVVLLLGLLLLREPRFAEVEERFLSWLIRHSQAGGAPVPLTVVEIGRDPLMDPESAQEADATPNATRAPTADAGGSAVSPLEFALFLQSALDFQPGVIAFESILKWRERDRDQEQVFLDQAMRVPKLLFAAELGAQTDPDAAVVEARGFSQVSGRRGDLPSFSGVARQPNEDLRLIATTGYINFPEEITSDIRVPMLFQYRGEVIPSFALQAILLWLRVTPADVKIVLGSHIALPQDRNVPISSDGTLLIDPTAARRARRLSLNELLLAAQQRDTGEAGGQQKLDLQDQIVLARTPENPLSPPNLVSAAIATIQSNKYLRRVHVLFDCAVLLLIGLLAGAVRRIDRADLLLYGIAFTAAYCLVAIGTISRWSIWLPGVLPLAAVWIVILAGLVFRDKAKDAREAGITIPPPIP